MNLLNILLTVPLLGFVTALFLPKAVVRTFTLTVSLLTFLLSLGLVAGNTPAVDVIWIQNPEIHFHLAVDGINLWLVVLSTFLTPIAVLLSWRSVTKNITAFFALFLLLEFGLIGVFAAFDLFLFYVFWEVTLVPMYLLTGIWGGERRIHAALKFFLYTFAGSVLMLAAIIFLYNRAGTSNYTAILDMLSTGRIIFSPTEELLMFLGFFAAFAIKLALFPVHTWLPEAYNTSPAGATLMLAAVMAKMGTYSIIRFCVPLFPTSARRCAPWIAVLAIISILYGALVALVQPNLKKVIAYSSMSHVGFIVLGIFSFTQMGLDGAVYQMIAHGISTGALFVLAGFLYERRGSLEIGDFGGVATTAPWLSTAFVIAAFASAGLPLLSNFVGEFLILQGTAQARFEWTAFAALGVILSACYLLWMVQRVFYGEASAEVSKIIRDLNAREWACVIPLLIMMVWLGTYTQSFLAPITASTSHILDQSKMNVPLRVQVPALPREVASAR